LHTTDSDGTWPWDKVLEECLRIGLSAYAITDHDTITRRGEILAWARKHKAKAIPGVELSTKENDETVHLLGYFLGGDLEKLEKKLKEAISARTDRNSKIIKKLQAMGYQISMEELNRMTTGGPIGRPHIAQVLLAKGYVESVRKAFQRFLGREGAAYVPKDDMPLKKGIELLNEAKAVTVVAHPGLLTRSAPEFEAALKRWRSWGLDGIEVYYPSHNDEQIGFLERMADKFGFLKTGGSDFHGDNKPNIKIGVGYGKLAVPDELMGPLFKRRDEIMS